jgi:hypothetical protein
MELNKLTIGEAKELAAMFGGNSCQGTSIKVGKTYLFRTVTHINIGTVTEIVGQDIVLNPAAWIADTGRWTDALRTGTLNEVEPYPDGTIINRTALIDTTPWTHNVPDQQK